MDVLVRASRYPDWDAGVVFATRLAGQLRGGLTALHVVQAGIPPVWASGRVSVWIRRTRCKSSSGRTRQRAETELTDPSCRMSTSIERGFFSIAEI